MQSDAARTGPSREEMFELFSTKMGWKKPTKLRESVFNLLWEGSAACSNFSICLDVSAGQCRYKPFYEHAQYVALDSAIGNATWDYSKIDIFGDAHVLPIKNDSIDVCVNATSLEHYLEPRLVFHEFARVLKPGGQLFLYVPFIHAEHEVPHDYFRYTRYGLAYFCGRSGLEIQLLRPGNGIFETSIDVIEFAFTLVNFQGKEQAVDLFEKTFKPLLNQLETMEGVVEDYPNWPRFPQMSTCYCLIARKPGKRIESPPETNRIDLIKKIVACPSCKGDLGWSEESLRCNQCHKVFPFKGSVPNLMPDTTGRS
ncbi:MAG: methyltransferase domain-containing protein [bacterium]